MCQALDKFLRVMAEDKEPEMREETVQSSSMPMSDVNADSPIMSSNCYVNPSTDQHRAMNGIITFS